MKIIKETKNTIIIRKQGEGQELEQVLTNPHLFPTKKRAVTPRLVIKD